MSQNGSELSRAEKIEVAPDVALFIASLDPAQRTFLVRAIAPSAFNIITLWNALGDWWNGQGTGERLAHITDSFNRFYQGREKGDDESSQGQG